MAEGVILEGVPLAPRTTWGIGGPARRLAQPEGVRELQALLRRERPSLVLGGGSNLLVDDAGIDGLVLDLSRGFSTLALLAQGVGLQVGAGVATRRVAHFACRAGLSGAEFLCGIPGSIGGALAMNAGAYGGEMKDILHSLTWMLPDGTLCEVARQEVAMHYRHTELPEGAVLTGARFMLIPDDPERIRGRMRDINRKRSAAQPLAFPSAGSTFKNPPEGPPAWRLIEEAGLRGAGEGAAQVAEKHCNFLINRGGATAVQMRRLMDRVQVRVEQMCGILLQPEVKILDTRGRITGDMR